MSKTLEDIEEYICPFIGMASCYRQECDNCKIADEFIKHYKEGEKMSKT